MIRRKPSSRWALWAFAAALLLKSAMPWLASVSAERQGKALVEVCTVYGVSMVAADVASGPLPAPHDPADVHHADHCALTALAALATAAAPLSASSTTPLSGVPSPRACAAAPPPDAASAWFSRLKHGPPAFA